jgi:micrococcal nuclease
MKRKTLPRVAALLVAAALVAAAVRAMHTSGAGVSQGSWAVVTKVVDGDTIRIGRTTVRLIGVDAPEIARRDKPGQHFGPEATEFTRQTLLGKRVRLELNPGDEIDAYGRLLAYVFLEDGTFFNRELVRHGYARAYTRFRFEYADDFRSAEAAARREGRGMWAARAGEAGAGAVIGNRRSKVYHLPGQQHYDAVAERNRVYFDSAEEAQRQGYRPAER